MIGNEFTTNPYYPSAQRLKARSLAATAKAKNKLEVKECVACGTFTKVHLHHEDYDKPLEVICLCSLCHKSLHGKRGDVGSASKRNFRVLFTINMLKELHRNNGGKL